MSTIRPATAGMSQIVADAGLPPGCAGMPCGVILPAAAGPATAHGWMAVGGRSTAARADADPRRCHMRGWRCAR
jgi:hypothetical protein